MAEISIEMMMGIYGSVLSTVLAILAVAKFMKERPRILVEAEIITESAVEGKDTHGVLMQVKRGDDVRWEEVDVEIHVKNAGAQPCQISDIFVETSSEIHQIRPSGLPVMLEPNTRYEVLVQPEYFAPKKPTSDGKLEDTEVIAVGVIDALGNKHHISDKNRKQLAAQCRALPLRIAAYRHKETGNIVSAFQIKDPGRITIKAQYCMV